MFRVLVTGSNGQVGQELMRYKPIGLEVIGLNSTELDITNISLTNKIISKLCPDLIINAAAFTAVDKAESDPQRAFDVNEKGVINLANMAKQVQCPLFHISTDYVFDGKSKIPYKETHFTSPLGVYGKSKLAGEMALKNNLQKYIIIRTSWVFGSEGSNFVKTMLKLGKERENLGVVSDQYGCPTSSASIAHTLWSLVEKYQQNKSLPWGIYHFSNSPKTTWFEFASEIFKQASDLQIDLKISDLKAIKSADYPTPAKRPEWSVLDCYKIEELLQFKVPDWKNELQIVLKELK